MSELSRSQAQLTDAVERAYIEQLLPHAQLPPPMSPLLWFWLYWKPGDPPYDGPIEGARQ